MGTIKFKNTDDKVFQVIRLGERDVSAQTETTENKPSVVLTEKKAQEEAKVLCEEKSLREPNVKHFRMSDGSFRAEIFNEPIHFYDESEGRFRSIDNTLCDCPACAETQEDFDGYENKVGNVRVKFAKKTDDKVLFSVTSGNYGVKCSLCPDEFQTENYAQKNCYAILPNADKPEKKLSDEIRYNDAFAGTDLQYIFSSGRIKENIIVKQRRDKYEYKFLLKLKNLDVALSEDGQRLELYTTVINEVSGESSEKVIFTIPAPYMFDSANAVCQNAEYELERKGSDYIFKVIADKEWINAEERKFPVTIDPVITINNNKITTIKTISSKSKISVEKVKFGQNQDANSLEYFAGLIDIPASSVSNSANYKVASVFLNVDTTSRVYPEGETNWKSSFLVKKSNNKCAAVSKWSDVSINGETVAYISKDQITCGSFAVDITKYISKGDVTLAIIPADTSNAGGGKTEYVETEAQNIKLIVNYTNNANIVSNKQQTNSVGRAGTGMLDLYTKNLVFVHEDISLGGERMPLNLSHIYNKKFATTMQIRPSGSNSSTDSIGLGKGWKTNYHQYILPLSETSTSTEDVPTPKYCYIDQYGNEIILAKTKINAKKYEIRDVVGKGLTYDETNRVLKDNGGNKLYFDDRGRLKKIENVNGITNQILYSGDRIWKITDGAGRHVEFCYNSYSASSTGSGGTILLSKIVWGVNHFMHFEYNSNFTLKTITYDNATYSSYEYDNTGCLSSIRDRSGYRISYSRSGENMVTISESTNVASISDGLKELCKETSGGEIEVDYFGNRTYVKPKHGNRIVHIFNSAGMAYCSYEDKSTYIGADSYNVANNIEYSGTINGGAFSVSSSQELKNYVDNGDFEKCEACWIQNEDKGYCEGITGSAVAEGLRSFRLNGEIDKVKQLSQCVNVPRSAQSFVFSAFAKARSLPVNDKTKFGISAQIFYEDGTSENEEYASFNYLEEDWQLAAIGLTKSKENNSKKIRYVLIKGEYSNNTGIVYFDNFRLTKGRYTKQTVETIDRCLYFGKLAIPFGSISKIKYYQENVGQIEKDISGLKLEDISVMLGQKATQSSGVVMINGECDCYEVNLSDHTIQIVFAGKTYDLFACELKTQSKITVEDGSKRTSVSLTDYDGKITSTAINTKNGGSFSTEYHYDEKGRFSWQRDFRGLLTARTYNDCGEVEEESYSSSGNCLMPIIAEYEYDGSGNLSVEGDERGYTECSTEYSYDKYGTLTSINLPDGQKINYNNNADGSFSVSSQLGTETSVNTIFTKHGLVTKTSSGDSEFDFTYDGFGNVTETKLNGTTISETEYKRDSAYNSADETTFNYVKHTYRNGNGNDYSEKTITDKDGNVVCVLGDCYTANRTKKTVEIMRVNYDKYGRTETITDKSLCNFDNAGGSAGKEIVYTNEYSADGRLVSVEIDNGSSIFPKSSLSEATDETGKVISKTISHIGNTKTYEYNYDEYNGEAYPDNRITAIRLPNNATVEYSYDVYSRILSRKISPSANYQITENYTYLRGGNCLNCGCKDRETNYVSNVSYSANGFSADIAYTYDNRGNISSVTEGGIVTSYTYDKLNRLKSERSSLTDVLTTYDYDINGNITAINKFKNGTSIDSTSFAYATTGINKGRLVEITRNTAQKSTITYDNVGNTCNYKNYMLKWERGRLLAAYGNNKYSYNADGIRIKKKTAEGVLHTYFVEGTRIHCERFLNHTNWYYYDATGITGMEHDGVRYFFQKNVQGDVMRIFDSCGRLVARYAYDAWGNHIVYDANGNAETAYNFIGNINPFRYRGYYFDVETGLYYLNTRYYDPSICRFINADDISYIEPETINGLNLYAYCLNNPIMYTDETGTMPNWLKWLIGGIAFAGAVVLTVLSGGSLAPVFIGMGVSIVLGGLIDGTISAVRGGSFGDGFANGAADGAMWGGIFALCSAAISFIKNLSLIRSRGVVIGKGMERVKFVADQAALSKYSPMKGYNIIKGSSKGGLRATLADKLSIAHNKAWIKRVMRLKKPIYDIGLGSINGAGAWYGMELEEVAKYIFHFIF